MRKKTNFASNLRHLILWLILIALVGLVGCGGSTDSAGETDPNSIENIVWQWTSVTQQSTREQTAVSNPEAYTIVFHTDGMVTGLADCNNFSGTYSQENGFSITLGATQLAFCGEDSLDQQYLTLLANVAAGGPDGSGNLALETAGGAERMLFQDGGPAPES
jgi:heat shock protein HslJ